MKKYLLGVGALLLLGNLTTTSILADDDLYVSGYFRYGTMVDKNGDQNWGKTWKRYTGALGNDDNSWEMTFSKQYEGYEGLWARIQSTIKGDMGRNVNRVWVDDSSGWSAYVDHAEDWGNKNLYLDGATIELGGFDPKSDISIWAGKGGVAKDNYNYLTDIFYTDYSGVGGGIKNIFDKFDLAYLQRHHEFWWDDQVNTNEATIHTFYGRFKHNDFHLDAFYNKNSNEQSNTAKDGYQLTANYNKDDYYFFRGGKTTYALQYGKGLGGDLGNNAPVWWHQDHSAYRFLTFASTQIESLTILNQFWIGYEKDHYRNEYLNGSVVGRIIYPLKTYLAMEAEVGVGFRKELEKGDGGDKSTGITEYKIAAGPSFIVPTLKGINPTIKLLGAYHGGSNIKNNEFRVGIQAEVWIPEQNMFR